MGVRVGIDTGGTFTDVVLMGDDGRITATKVPSTPKSPYLSVMNGLKKICSISGLTPPDISLFIHGTTVATNAVLEGKGAPLALLVTKGFKDVLLIARQDRPRLYQFREERARPLVPRRLIFEVTERVLHDGAVHMPLEESEIPAICDQLRSKGIKSVAVCYLHSYANFDHEMRTKKIINSLMPDARVSLSCEVLPEFKEFERMSTTVINSYVSPVIGRYIGELNSALKTAGLGSEFHIIQSNGGIMSAATAQEKSVHTLLSGPAAGAQGGLILGKAAGFENVITIDIGGTSADISLAKEGELSFAYETEIAGHVVKAKSIEIKTVGAGGGSIAWIDPGGALQVGPHSAGADPGPACYCMGGTEPTVTDANLVLGRLNPDSFLGGEMRIDPKAAREVILEKVAGPLRLCLERAAEGIIEVINATMVKGIKYISVEKGYDPREFALVAFGGNGPVHASELAKELNISKIIVPWSPGVHSALGLLMSDFRFDYVRTFRKPLMVLNAEMLNGAYAELESAALAQMGQNGVRQEEVLLIRSADIRYEQQGYTLEIPIASGVLPQEALSGLADNFHAAHRKVYGFCHLEDALECTNLRLAAIGLMPKPQLKREFPAGSSPQKALKARREVYLKGRWCETSIYRRDLLGPGSSLEGPAIIEQFDSTTALFPGQNAEVDHLGNIIIFA